MALYFGTVCFGTIVPDLVLEFRWPGTEAPHPDSPVHPQRGPGLRDRGRTEKLSMSKSKEHIHLRFQAVVIASQLPDNRAEALLVLDYARHMVMEFLDEPSCVSDNVQAVSDTVETRPQAPRLRDRFTIQ